MRLIGSQKILSIAGTRRVTVASGDNMANESDLEPIAPSEAVDLYIDYKETNCANSTVRSARYRLKPFVEWCEQNGIENLNDITGRDAHRFRM